MKVKVKVAGAVEARCVKVEGASDVTMRMLIGPDDEAPTFNMRLFEVAVGGHTPFHTHAWEHEVYVLAGEGLLRTTDGDVALSAGECVFVPGGEPHQFLNPGQATLRFLCLVPRDSG